jgi:hypothetical protein
MSNTIGWRNYASQEPECRITILNRNSVIASKRKELKDLNVFFRWRAKQADHDKASRDDSSVALSRSDQDITVRAGARADLNSVRSHT